MIVNFIKVWDLLSFKERKQLLLVTGLQFVSGLMDMVGVASVLPFLSVIVNPEQLQIHPVLENIKNWTQLSDNRFIVLLGLFSLLTLLVNQVIRLGNGWYGQYIFHQIWVTLSKRLFNYYLRQPYPYHIQHSSSELLEKLQVRVNAAVAGVISPIFLLLSSCFSVFFLTLLLILAEPMMTLLLFSVIVLIYVMIYQKIKHKIEFYGKIGPDFSVKSFKLVSGAFGGIKEIKIYRYIKNYLDFFETMAKGNADAEVKKTLFMSIPGGMVDVVAFGGMLLVTIILINSARGIQEIVPIIGLYALALRRLLPVIQDIYRQVAQIQFYNPSLQIIYPDLVASLISNDESLESSHKTDKHFLSPQKIALNNLSFTYANTSKKVLSSISLDINAGCMLGIAGGSGAGKTTLVDLILGLFEPDSGNILLDDQLLKGQLLAKWQANIGYVPQAGFIADTTIAGNIGFGFHEVEVDMQRVRKVAKIAQLSEFIESELPLQYETLVGERGVRLSGGQRQRLCIARSLYRDPQVLILDEATSALDGITEEKIMNAIREFYGKKTILLIAHRLATLQACDTIILLENGKLVDQGSYQFLMDSNVMFKRMARKIMVNENED